MTDERVERICRRRGEEPLPGWEARDLAVSGWPHIVYLRGDNPRAHSYEQMLEVENARTAPPMTLAELRAAFDEFRQESNHQAAVMVLVAPDAPTAERWRQAYGPSVLVMVAAQRSR